MIRAFEAIFDRQMSRSQIAQRRRDKEWRNPPRLALVYQDGGVVDCFEAANAGADHHTSGVAVILGFRHPSRVRHRLAAGDHPQMDEAIHLLLVLDRYPLIDVQAAGGAAPRRHLARHLAGQVLGIECLDRADPGFGIDQPAPDMFDAHAQGTGNAHARHHHTPHCRGPFRACQADALTCPAFQCSRWHPSRWKSSRLRLPVFRH